MTDCVTNKYNTKDNGCFAGECHVTVIAIAKEAIAQGLKFSDIIINKTSNDEYMYMLAVPVTTLKKLHYNLQNITTIVQFNKILVKDLKVGDHVICIHGMNEYKATKITHILKIKVSDPIEMICVGNLNEPCMLTSWHPIFNNTVKDWEFAINSPSKLCSFMYKGKAIYNFVLENSHKIIINNVQCLTLGHDFIGPVVSHPYFGSKNIITDLNKISSTGYVIIDQSYFHRDPMTNKICKISHPMQNLQKWQYLVDKMINS